VASPFVAKVSVLEPAATPAHQAAITG